jgi:hypothetical protein
MLRFLVVCTADGDVTMGFEGYPWHTHGDTVAAFSSDSPEAATQRFVDDLLCGRSIIAMSTVAGAIRDIWITDEPAAERQFCGRNGRVPALGWDEGRRLSAAASE